MEISDTWTPLLLSAVRDAVRYNENLLNSETLRERHDYEEHVLQLHIFLDHLKEEYLLIEEKVGLPLEKIIPSIPHAANVVPFLE